ncbi:MAG: hypothetical protein J6A56_00465 [Clostridia bacterium]|nr:hypothetical protein [Clostridia bacterium]
MREPKRISIFLGHYGSGKTELAVNYALYLRSLGKKVVVIDFDLVNPYFRTKDAEKLFEENGISLIAPAFANTNLENPTIPAEIFSIFEDKEVYAIFDVGGGEDGSIPLGFYHQQLAKEDCDVFFVLNQRRLLTADLEGALDIYGEIAAVARIGITGLINNTHLKEETTSEMILEGQELAEEVADALKIPVVYISGAKEMLDVLPEAYEPLKFPIQFYINLMF